MHVPDPELVLSEVVRCVRPGGLITVFEPDWMAFRVTSDVLPEQAAWLTSVAHPDIAGRLWGLLESLRCHVLDRVEELSVWRSLSTLERVTGFPASVDRAVAAGQIDRAEAEEWVCEQRARESAGTFLAFMPKVLVLAVKD
jgi:SAM-dependent methyltransferase